MENIQVQQGRGWYDKNYKLLLIIPALLLLISLIYLASFYAKNGDFLNKDVSLTGGTSVSVFDANVDIANLKLEVTKSLPESIVREISDIRSGKQVGFLLETKEKVDITKTFLEKYLGYKLTNGNSSIEFSGSSLSNGFYQQLRNAVVAAFLLMAWVVFFIFTKSSKIKGIATMLTFLGLKAALPNIKILSILALFAIIAGFILGLFDKDKKKKDYFILTSTFAISLALFFIYPKMIVVLPASLILIWLYIKHSVPSIAVILAAFADIVMTVAVVDLLGIQLSAAGIVAFLMLIGYSVDTDILLTSRLLRSQEGTVNQRIYGAFKTGITMTLTAIAAVGISFIIIYGFSNVLRQMFGIILIGLFFDIMNTWITNASMLKWYMEANKLQ